MVAFKRLFLPGLPREKLRKFPSDFVYFEQASV